MRARRMQAGMTLVELMVSLTIGLVILTALIALFAGNGMSNRVASAQAEMNEDAQHALQILAGQIRQAGFNPQHAGFTTTFALPGGHGLFGCRKGFSNVLTATATSSLTCNGTAPPEGEAIAVTYEADIYNTTPAAGTPTNCLGAPLPLLTDATTSGTFYAAQNRYYVKNGGLFCATVGGTAASPAVSEALLVDNVERLEFSYGAAQPVATGGTRTQAIVGYLTADELGPATGTGPLVHTAFPVSNSAVERWASVVAVRVCLVMRSAVPVFDHNVTSNDCNGMPGPVSDRYLRRAYSTTVALRNRVMLQ